MMMMGLEKSDSGAILLVPAEVSCDIMVSAWARLRNR
jgi:hypothetical protein